MRPRLAGVIVMRTGEDVKVISIARTDKEEEDPAEARKKPWNPLKTQRVPKNKKQKTSPFGLAFLCLKNRKTACKGGFLTYTVLRGSDCSILDLLVNDADDRQHHGSGSDADMLQIVVDAMRLSRGAVSLVHRGNAVHECVHGRGRNDGTCPFLKLIFGHTAANYQ